ncbi:hypothetical protein BT63DRAFT_452055 [Microthyrium microscopicum]|uniref:Uncharacterized protein n=1 Tax=Microthyrium microscopicum TaxID=703497 RepID=A0A6A6UJ35_9PEZI|nr:hypothetical protein BT63DRAFT_452055 [Microthyrium microscopicum]
MNGQTFPDWLRLLLLIFSLLSFLPQIERIVSRKECSILAPNYILFNLITATEHFAFYLLFIIDYPPPTDEPHDDLLVGSPPSTGDYLNLAQFALTALYHLTLFGLYLYFPQHGSRTGFSKSSMVALYLCFLSISVMPVLLELPNKPPQKGGSMSFFGAMIAGPHAHIVHPLVTAFASASLAPQLRAIRAGPGPGALSIPSLLLQSVTFTLLALSWMIRLPLPRGYTFIPWWYWYALVGWAAVDDAIFAIYQGVLWWTASSHGIAQMVSEAQPLLSTPG